MHDLWNQEPSIAISRSLTATIRSKNLQKKHHSRLTLLIVLLTVCVLPSGVSSQDADSIPVAELDVFRGSSLGVRIEEKGDYPVVTDIYSHVSVSSPFLKDDQIQQLGDLEFPGSTLAQVGELLKATDPESELAATVIRGDVKIRLNVTTLRKEFMDIQAIYRRLSSNRVIEQHLQGTGREELLDNITDRMVKSVSQSQSPRHAAEALNRIIDEIGVSHTAIIPVSAGLGFSTRPKGSLGLVLQRHIINGRAGYFVIDLKPGSCSHESELKLGDEVLAINNVPISQSRRLVLSGHEDRHQLFAIQSDIEESVRLRYLRSPFDDADELDLKTSPDPNTVSSLKSSKRIIEVADQKVAYIRFWNLMSMGLSVQFAKYMNEDFAECDAVVMDLRGRGGIVPAVLALNRTVGKVDKPVVVVIDGLTRSAKEMLAYLLKKQDHVHVVGMKTSGAVTGATVTQLPSGNSMMIPVASAEALKHYIDGAILEGVGVEPDEHVNYFVPYSAGNDRILNVALQRATELVSSARPSPTTSTADAQSTQPIR